MNEITSRVEEVREHVAGLVADVFARGDGAASFSDAEVLATLRSLGSIVRLAEACIVACVAEVLSRSTSLARDERLTTLAGCRDAVELTQRALLNDRAHASRVVTVAKGVRREARLDGSLRPACYEALRSVLLAGDLSVAGFLAATQELDRAGARIGAADRELADAELAGIARGVGYVPVVGSAADADDGTGTGTGTGETSPAGGGPDDGEEGDGADDGEDGDGPHDSTGGDGRTAAIPIRPLPEDLRRCADRVLAHLDPDGAEPRDREASARRGLRLGQARDGLVPISGRLETAVAAGFLRLVDAIEKPKGKKACVEFTNPAPHASAPPADSAAEPGFGTAEAPLGAEEAADTGGGAATTGEAPPPKRLREQILHDVFATVVTVAARSEEVPALGGAAPTLVVSIDAETLANGAGYAELEGADLVTTYAVAEQTVCTGVIQRVFQDRGRIVRLETTERVFTAAQRRAIVRRDRECVIPGCHVSANWCEIHHVLEHALGGPTHTDNGVLVCFHHHRTLHCGGWSIRMRDGRPEIRGPAGWDPSRAWRVPDTRQRSPRAPGAASGQRDPADASAGSRETAPPMRSTAERSPRNLVPMAPSIRRDRAAKPGAWSSSPPTGAADPRRARQASGP